MMDTYYVTGSTAGLYPNEVKAKFNPICSQLFEAGAKRVICVSQFGGMPGESFKQIIDQRLKAVSSVKCVVFTDDWKDTIESRFEFKEAGRLKKDIRMNTTSDLIDIQRSLKGQFHPSH